MQQKFFSSLVLTVFLNLLVKPLAIFGIDAVVQNRVGAEEYGLYFSLLNFTYIFNIILDFGITNYNTKYVAQYPHLVKRYMGKIIPLRLLLFLTYALVSIGMALALGYEGRQFVVLAALIFNQFLISIIQYLRSYFAGLLLFRIDILLSVLDRALLILIAGFLLYDPSVNEHFALSWFIAAQTASYLLTALLAVALLVRKIGIPRFHWSPAFNRVMLRKSFPYALLILLMMLYNRIDAVMIERLLPGLEGRRQAGIYAQAFRILDACMMFGMLFSNLLFPIFSRLIKERTDVSALLDTASRLLLSFSLAAAAACFFYPHQILRLIYTDNLGEAAPVFQWVMLSFIPVCVILIYGTLLTANSSLKVLNWLSFYGLLLNVGLNIVLIPSWGALGASWATLATQGGVALLQLFFVWKYFRIEFSPGKLFRYAGFATWLVLSWWAIPRLLPHMEPLLLFLGSAFVATLALGMIQWRALPEMLRK